MKQDDPVPRRALNENNRIALREARSVIEEHERVQLTRRDSLLVRELLENPPAPNVKLRKAARACPNGRESSESAGKI